MIEVVYKDEKQHAKGNEGIFQLPRNVRQIGTTDQNYRVYMEDYVYTFLGRAAASGENKEEKERHLAVFMGETKWDAGTCYLFIRGAVLVSGGEISHTAKPYRFTILRYYKRRYPQPFSKFFRLVSAHDNGGRSRRVGQSGVP